MAAVRELAELLCIIALLSAVMEVLLAGRRGGTLVGLLLALSGIVAILTKCAEIL